MAEKTTRLIAAKLERPEEDQVTDRDQVQRVIEVERQWTSRFLELLNGYDPEDRAMFRYIIAQFLSKFTTLEGLARHLSMNSTTIMRWATGEMTPPRPHRASVVAQLRLLLEASAKTSAMSTGSYFQAVLEAAAKLMENRGGAFSTGPRET